VVSVLSPPICSTQRAHRSGECIVIKDILYNVSNCLQVANVVGRAELLCCTFFLLSIVSYHFAINKGPSHLTRWPLVTLSILLSTLAMFSKEQGITSIGVCLVLDVLACWDLVWSKLHMWLRGKNGITDDVSFKHHMHRIGKRIMYCVALL